MRKKQLKSQLEHTNKGKFEQNDKQTQKQSIGISDFDLQLDSQSVMELGDPPSDNRMIKHHEVREHQQNLQQIKPVHKNNRQKSIKVKIGQEEEQQPNQSTQNRKWKKFIYISLILALTLTSIILYVLLSSYPTSSSPATATDNKITLIMLSTNMEQQSYKSIKSYLDNHKQQFSYFVIGVHKQGKFKFSSQYKEKVDKLGYEIDWVYYDNYVDITKHEIEQQQEKYIPSIQFVDKLIHKVSTEYYFFTTTQWHLQNNYFITYSKAILQNFPTVAQILPNEQEKIQRQIQLEREIGFSFACGLHRIRDYYSVVGVYGGYEKLLKKYKQNDQIQKINRISQYKLSREYLKMNLLCIIMLRFKVYKNYMNTLPLIKTKQENPYTKQQHYKSIYKNNRQKQLKEYIDKYSNNFIDNILHNRNKKNHGINSKKNNGQYLIKNLPISDYLIDISTDLNNDKLPAKIYEIELLKQLKQLPFCIVIPQNLIISSESDIIESISSQNYSNYHIINVKQHVQQNIPINYFTYIQIIKKQCTKNSLVMFTENPLKINSLHYLNNIHQNNKAWISYSVQKSTIQLHAFYYRIYELLHLNDFKVSHQSFLTDHKKQVLTLSMLQLCRMFAKKVEKQRILIDENKHSYYSIYEDSSQQYQRYPYTKILRLSQDFSLNIQSYQKAVKQKQTSYHILSEVDMKRAIDRQEQFYLPINHSIYHLEHQSHKRLLNQSNSEQNHLCVTILNHNNRQNFRYKKMLQSVIYQFYDNYHIVFIDDNSTDQSLDLSKLYLKMEGFPSNKIIFIQNLQRNYATYNIINAAFNFCNVSDIQVVLDGDDQIISRDAFAIINDAYIKNPKLWVVYSNYKTNYQDYGRSAPFRSQSEYIKNGKRVFVSNIGPIRTWRVNLISSIPAEYHKMSDGKWLDTVYDDALQHSLVQLSTTNRTRYINQILYEYNIKYGDNDDSNQQKITHRASVYRHIMNLKPLSPLENLDQITKHQAIRRELTEDIGKKYIKI